MSLWYGFVIVCLGGLRGRLLLLRGLLLLSFLLGELREFARVLLTLFVWSFFGKRLSVFGDRMDWERLSIVRRLIDWKCFRGVASR